MDLSWPVIKLTKLARRRPINNGKLYASSSGWMQLTSFRLHSRLNMPSFASVDGPAASTDAHCNKHTLSDHMYPLHVVVSAAPATANNMSSAGTSPLLGVLVRH